MARRVEGEPYTRITSPEAAEMLRQGNATVIDVRTTEEFAEGHVKGAQWLHVDDVINRFDELPKEGKLLFICMVGARSGLAAESAAAMGADQDRLYNVEDGTPGWIEAGLPVSTGMDE